MRRFVTVVLMFCMSAICAGALLAADSAKSDKPAEKAKTSGETKAKSAAPADRVVVMYFHRTQRCPTCRRMGSYTEEAVKQGFVNEMKKGTVEFHFIDFQDENNAALAEGYGVSGPTLIVAQVIDNKVKQYKSLTEMWTKNNDKDEFFKYVRENVSAYKKAETKSAAKQDAVKPAR
ncbi:MAG: nitrophenyl compound nitroreductase subunit ArsF family protein [Planctomycetaceae bacterium]|nr:nitrophenyl compound nitroreductase subunit ArsF family protein [Planctomycetaceae bacterium]